jgi:hypothetical protein
MDSLFWLPFQRLYALLQRVDALAGALPPDVAKELDHQAEWLLAGPSIRFMPPQQASLAAITAGRSVTIHGKKLAVQPRLLDATRQLSALLVRCMCLAGLRSTQQHQQHVKAMAVLCVTLLFQQGLDQFQAHLLLKRWSKESGRDTAIEALPATQQAQLGASDLLEVGAV